jgi:hypothetical protein
MSALLLLVLAYLGGFFLVAPLGALAGTLVGFSALLKRSEAWFFAASFVGAVASFLLLRLWFLWLDVSFSWWAYLVCMVSVVLYEGQRASRGGSTLYATGALFGIVASIYWGFIDPPSIGRIN